MSKKLILVVAVVSFGCVGPGIKLGPYTLTPMATVKTIGVELTKTDSGDVLGTVGASLQTIVDQFTGLADKVMGGSD